MAATTGNIAISTRIACWLIGLAGRVINVPCEVEMEKAPPQRAPGSPPMLTPHPNTPVPPKK